MIGPTYPFRGGIAHYTTLLARHLQEQEDTLFISFTRQYPRWLFPGRSDRDPSPNPLQTNAEYLLDPLNPLSWRRTLHRIREWQPEIVVIPWWVPFWMPTWAFLGRGIKRLPNRPTLLFICHNVLPHEKSLFDRTAVRLALAAGDGYVVHAQPDAEKLRRIFPQARVQVTPLPTYASLAANTNQKLPVTVPSDRPLLLFCGFVRPYKGLDVLLDALPLVLTERPVHLLVAGEFWSRNAPYYGQIARLGLENDVIVLNRYLTNEELSACIAQADVVVLPYRSATQSAVIQAAFGQNTPVITTNVGGLPEVVDDGRTGLIVPPENPPLLAQAINRFFAEALGPEMSRQIAEQSGRFSWQRLVDALLTLGREGGQELGDW
ncbi:MAG: glycosyltransferase [Candidatus Promineifilaceae bacterium]